MSNTTPTNKLSVYLIKEELIDDGDILKDIDTLRLANIAGVGSFYFGQSHTFPPSWMDTFFGSLLENADKEQLFNSSSKALLLLRVDVSQNKKRVFAIPFGYGKTLLLNGVWEERFGLRVVLNTVDSENLRRIDKRNLSSIPRDTSEQLSVGGAITDFGINIEQDLIRSVTAKTRQGEEIFGKTITGKDSLNLSVKVDISTIHEFLAKVYEKYESNEYKESFAWVDYIAEIRNPQLREKLNMKLIDKIRSGDIDKIWMAVPELVNWEDISGFSYKANSDENEIKSDIVLQDFMHSLSAKSRENLRISLFDKSIYCWQASSNVVEKTWKAFNCLYCEMQDDTDNTVHLLSNGKWYNVEKTFVEQVDNEYKQLIDKKPQIVLPGYRHENEREYNKYVAKKDPTFCCMDGDLISHGGGYGKIEFCDLYSAGKAIVHVKRYGSSSVLSHLFFQGVVSGELFLSDPIFREKLNRKLPASHELNLSCPPKSSDYNVVFAIISKSGKELDIPFFSKISLKNAKRTLETFGYSVSLVKVSTV